MRVPEDLAVVGFDGTEAARYAYPPLTTVVPGVVSASQQMRPGPVRLQVSGDSGVVEFLIPDDAESVPRPPKAA